MVTKGEVYFQKEGMDWRVQKETLHLKFKKGGGVYERTGTKNYIFIAYKH